MNKIGIVIVTYNRINLLKKCIECAKKQRNVDILVIDNASTDGTDKLFYKKDDHCVSYYNTGKNLGGAGGFNFGIKKAVEKKYEYILVMDDDTILQDNTIAELRKVINSIDDFSFLACKVLWKDGNLCLMNRPKISNNVLNYHKYIDEGVICVDSSSFVGCLLNTKYIKNVYTAKPTMECPDGKLYPLSSIILNSVGLGLCNICFNTTFKIVVILKFVIIAAPIFLFFIDTNNTAVKNIKNIAPPKFVIILIIGVIKSDIKYFEMILYPI